MEHKNTVSTKLYQRTADALCWLRIGAAPLIAEHAISNQDHRSYLFAGTIAAIGATDKLDGILSRRAAKQAGTPTSEKGAWLDQLSDKVYVHGALGGIAMGSLLEGRLAFGLICAGSQAVMLGRDAWVTKERKQASLEGKTTKAQWLGKVKTAMQVGAISVAASPVTNIGEGAPINSGEVIAAGGVAATAALAVASGISLVHNLREQENTPSEINQVENAI